MIISVIGMGYIGLPTAAILAKNDFNVLGVDNNQSVVEVIRQGGIHIVEPGLLDIVRSSVASGKLRVDTATQKSDIFIIAVPTPINNDNSPNLSFVESAIKSISHCLEPGNLLILESTSPVGTSEKCISWLNTLRPDLLFPVYGSKDDNENVYFSYSPERVLPGKIIEELIENDRVIGGVSPTSAKIAAKFYESFVNGQCLITDSRSAELCKLVENSYRDLNIAFANELSMIADKFDTNVWDLIDLANHHPRVDILQPGPGVGGHCIAVDPWFLVHSAPNEALIIKQARLVNDSKPNYVINKIIEKIADLDQEISNLSIACLGLAFKADIDDLRESPALKIALEINKMDFKYQYIIEPNIDLLPAIFDQSKCSLVELSNGVKKSDFIIVLVDHAEFYIFDQKSFHGKEVIDLKGIWKNL